MIIVAPPTGGADDDCLRPVGWESSTFLLGGFAIQSERVDLIFAWCQLIFCTSITGRRSVDEKEQLLGS